MEGFSSRGAHDSCCDAFWAHQGLLPRTLLGSARLHLRKPPISSPPNLRICKSARATRLELNWRCLLGKVEGKPFGQLLTHLPSANKGTIPSLGLSSPSCFIFTHCCAILRVPAWLSWPRGPDTRSLFAGNACQVPKHLDSQEKVLVFAVMTAAMATC